MPYGVGSCRLFPAQRAGRDFFGQGVKVMTLNDTVDLALDPRFVGWRVVTTYNAGDARVRGAEFNVKHSLAALGGWGRHFSAFANGTKLQLEGNQDASFEGFIPLAANAGISFSRKPIMMMLKCNYHGTQKGTRFPSLGSDAFEYDDWLRTFDLNVECQLSSRVSLFLNGQNIFDAPNVRLRQGSETPDYARRFRVMTTGASFRAGIKGTF